MTISNGSFRMRSMPSRPVVATLTWHPSAVSGPAIEIGMRGPSSMIRTFGCGMASGLLPDHRPDRYGRQPHDERGPAADLALDRNLPAMSLDDPQAHRQPQTRPLALPLGREERIEDLRQDVGRAARAGILHLDRAPRAVVAGADRHDPFPAHRLHPVADQIHEHLLAPLPVPPGGRQHVP